MGSVMIYLSCGQEDVERATLAFVVANAGLGRAGVDGAAELSTPFGWPHEALRKACRPAALRRLAM